jgi:hypothetical protein
LSIDLIIGTISWPSVFLPILIPPLAETGR